jgi:hypothetical protein
MELNSETQDPTTAATAFLSPGAESTAAVPPDEWLAREHLADREVDCVIALMLKILDGKCKMSDGDKAVATRLYDAMGARDGAALGAAEHALIRTARNSPDQGLLDAVYERRVLAETRISRPVMKGFKARLRRDGVLPRVSD